MTIFWPFLHTDTVNTFFHTVLNFSFLAQLYISLIIAHLHFPVLQEIIGWRPRRESQRIVIALSDADYHYALDARVILTVVAGAIFHWSCRVGHPSLVIPSKQHILLQK